MKVSRGFTLIELLLTMAVLGVLLSLAWQILVPSLHFWNTNQTQAALEEDGLVLQNRLQRDLQQTARESVAFTHLPDPWILGFMSLQQEGTVNPGFDPCSGETLWQRYVVYFLNPAGQVIRKTWPNFSNTDAGLLGLSWSFPTYQPVPLTRPQLLQLSTTMNGTEQCIGSNVRGMSAETNGSYEIDFVVTLYAPSSDGRQTCVRNFGLETRL